MKISICNPLPAALLHYSCELVETLGRIGFEPAFVPAFGVENRAGAAGKIINLGGAVRNARFGGGAYRSTVQCWPSLGLLEPLLWSSQQKRNFIIFHDPVPIRKQVGFDRVSRLLAKHWRSANSPVIIVHSSDAYIEASRLFPRMEVRKALHPVLSEMPSSATPGVEVVVAGQFKPERNVELLRHLGPMLRARGFLPRIYGRGWPEHIPGWDIESRFLTEVELDRALDRAAVVLIPYKNYFQSGIAIRALERGRLSVSPENSFARDVFGDISGSIYSASANAETVLESIASVAATKSAPKDVFEDYQRCTDETWRIALSEFVHPERFVRDR